MENEKRPEKISEKSIENVSGGEVRQYRSLRNLWRKRFEVTNDMSGKTAVDGIEDFDEALKLNEKLNSKINESISQKK